MITAKGITQTEDRTVASSGTRTGHAPVQMRVPFAASSAPIARQRLRQWMAESGSSRERLEDARVIVSELVANAIRHAQPLPDGTLLIAWHEQGPEVEITVTDGGAPTQPRAIAAPSSALAGRGMSIVETLASSWWAERTRSRSTVHARLLME